ncbi:hypothetical protein FNJ84_17105 [Paracoccus sp. M683]|uniref:hypothetical protein n=1 Tax=Paracoccus sp. M683 TaxID=2594268 RepID=UPI0011981261|nr:hypothetical protein [Paracoccus sp. M683]TRW95210.1 hypothetical protein FNJ84_17105 [Paracoccus sp. M683]
MAFLVEQHPERFSNGLQTSRELQNTLRNHAGSDGVSQSLREATVQREYQDYLKNGNAPLTRSPIPPAADADGDGAMDAEFAAYCPACQTGEPCCLTGGAIIDADEPSRKIEWPVAAGAEAKSRLYVIAKDVVGTQLQAKVKLKGEGKDCQVGKAKTPGFAYMQRDSAQVDVARAETEIGVVVPQSMSTLVAAADLAPEIIPQNFLIALAIIDMAFASSSDWNGDGFLGVIPRMCVRTPEMSKQLNVTAWPQFELNGEGEFNLEAGLHTSGGSFTTDFKSKLTGKYGSFTLTQSNERKSGNKNHEKARGRRQAPGLVGTISSILGNFSSYLSMSSADPAARRSLTSHASGVLLQLVIKLNVDALKLEEKEATPDLLMRLAGFDISATLTVSGTIDFIDVAAQALLSPAGARLVQKVRAEAADTSNAVNADLQAAVTLSTEGQLKFACKTPFTWVYVANGQSHYENDGGEQEFTGHVKIRGQAQISLHVEAEVWLVSAEAGAAGSLHTGWNWEWKIGDSKRLTRYYFEGLIASARGYASMNVTTSTSRKPPKRERGNAEITSKTELEQTVGKAEIGSDKWKDPRESSADGARYVILEPTVATITDSAPPWEKY